VPAVPPAIVPVLVVVGRPVMATTAAATPATSNTTGPLILTALARVFIVKNAWQEWQEGLAGQPALRELETR
jgi:hypothetical protein